MPPTIETTPITKCNNCGSDRSHFISSGPDFEYGTCSNETRFCQCADCSLVYLYDRPATSELGTIYPDSYIPYEFEAHLGPVLAKARAYVQRQKIKPISRFVDENALIVDVGCGGGEFLRIMKQYGDPSWRLVGVDISEKAMQSLAKSNIEGVKGRFEALDWRLPRPNAIIMNQVIEHLDDPSAVVQKAFDLLTPGGVLMMETPSVDAWDARIFRKRHWGGWHFPRHWILYTPKTLEDLTNRSGFKTVEVTHILSPNFWLQSVHHWMSERGAFLRWLAPTFDVKNPILLCAASALDVLQVNLTGKTSNFRIVVQKP